MRKTSSGERSFSASDRRKGLADDERSVRVAIPRPGAPRRSGQPRGYIVGPQAGCDDSVARRRSDGAQSSRIPYASSDATVLNSIDRSLASSQHQPVQSHERNRRSGWLEACLQGVDALPSASNRYPASTFPPRPHVATGRSIRKRPCAFARADASAHGQRTVRLA